MKTIRLFFEAFSDLGLRLTPNIFIKKDVKYKYAFLVHPRDLTDIYRKYPVLKMLPSFLIRGFAKSFWPVVVSKITGLVSQVDQKEVSGYVITIAMTAEQMLKNRPLAIRRIRQAVTLAEKKGAKIIGLGALTSSVTRGGLDLVDHTNIAITTGHAYTAYNITEYVRTLCKKLDLEKTRIKVAVVGAAGSVGSTCAKILAQNGYQNILLIDVKRKHERFDSLPKELEEINSSIEATISFDINDVKTADFIITATNAPETVVHSKDVRPGTFIIDDAQPSDVASEVFERTDVVVLEAGAVHTPNISTNFNMGLQDRHDNFCCMAEVLILASKHWSEHYVIDRVNLDLVSDMAEEGKKLGFTVAKFQNDRQFISDEHLERVGALLKEQNTHVH